MKYEGVDVKDANTLSPPKLGDVSDSNFEQFVIHKKLQTCIMSCPKRAKGGNQVNSKRIPLFFGPLCLFVRAKL